MIRIYALWLALTLISCGPVYVPQSRNVPLFSGKGEFNGNVSAGSSGTNIQAAYALSDRVGMITNFMTANNESSVPSNNRRHTAGEIGLGYYQRQAFAFEVYAGMGLGKGHGSDSASWFTQNDHRELAARYHKFFVQPSIGIFSKRFEGAFTVRVTAVEFDDLDLWMDGEEKPISQHTRFFFEPALTVKAYPFDERFYVLGQLGVCHLMNSERDDESPDYENMPYEPFNLSVGLGVKLKRKSDK